MNVDVFYAPHADDEAIGMAGSICQAKDAGRRVVLVMVTDNRPSRRALDLFSARLRCNWHLGQTHPLAHIDLGLARMLEFYDAAARLGADEICSLGIPEQLAREDYPRFVDAVGFSMQRYATMYPGATHHVVAGDVDRHRETDGGNIAHQGCAEAARQIADVRSRLHSHRIYAYSHPAAERRADVVVELSPAVMDRKRHVLDAYRIWEPAAGRVAFGYHSVPELIDAAAMDPREFVDLAA